MTPESLTTHLAEMIADTLRRSIDGCERVELTRFPGAFRFEVWSTHGYYSRSVADSTIHAKGARAVTLSIRNAVIR